MNNSHDNISDELLARFLAETANEQEIAEVKNWLDSAPENKKQLADFELIWEKTSELSSNHITVDTDAAWDKIRMQMKAKNPAPENLPDLKQETITRELPVNKKFSFPVWIAAAVSVTILAFGWFIFKTQSDTPEQIQIATTNNTGETTLPDGTRVFLNYNSSISYPENFSGDIRSVALKGEAFFDVKPDASHPFVIDANGTMVRVLGTSFNVKAYKKELVRVDVKTGKVRVSKNNKKIELTKGESAEVLNDTLKSMRADANIMSYKTQVYDFNSTNLGDVVNTLREGYHSDIRLSNQKLAQCRLTISFQKEPLDTTLSVIAETLELHLRKEGKTYWLEGSGCQ
ncbi:FecR family protein [Dyadobacter subterraneus]|uniref:FecR domain-containing protein n=1 Tax=Dyadobacter subterraneus TaxID=2773304 RepID=A0ABR9W4Y8_9BACT|nr:FecR domain-containing protein [Dyadobacter subterraneus]MBE9460511.1 FecR domain-containing protein [Dyadobacter subterraneus]